MNSKYLFTPVVIGVGVNYLLYKYFNSDRFKKNRPLSEWIFKRPGHPKPIENKVTKIPEDKSEEMRRLLLIIY